MADITVKVCVLADAQWCLPSLTWIRRGCLTLLRFPFSYE
jgi:hypothetical protein